MLTLQDLYRLLDLNSRLLIIEMRPNKRRKSDMKRLIELQLHRFEIFKCIIDEQNKLLSQKETRKVA